MEAYHLPVYPFLQVLGDRQIQVLLQVKERHVFGVERLGTTLQSPRNLEEAFPEVARRLSEADASSPRSPRSAKEQVTGMLRTVSGNFPTLRKSSSAGSMDGNMGGGPAIPSM